MNILIQSTYYPENPPKDFNEWIGGIVRTAEQYRRVRHNERQLNALAGQLAGVYGTRKDSLDQGLNQN